VDAHDLLDDLGRAQRRSRRGATSPRWIRLRRRRGSILVDGPVLNNRAHRPDDVVLDRGLTAGSPRQLGGECEATLFQPAACGLPRRPDGRAVARLAQKCARVVHQGSAAAFRRSMRVLQVRIVGDHRAPASAMETRELPAECHQDVMRQAARAVELFVHLVMPRLPPLRPVRRLPSGGCHLPRRLLNSPGLRGPVRRDYAFDAARRVTALVLQCNTACAQSACCCHEPRQFVRCVSRAEPLCPDV
jgi:hypothetical protein